MKHTTKLALAAGALAAVVPCAQAQNADSLIDKLVEKGILTTKEAQNLREESDKDFNRAYSAKTGLPDWVTSLRFNGDFRGRFEQHSIDNSGASSSDRNRWRYRLRFGATASLLDDFEIGFRLASGNPTGAFGGNPVSANTDLSDGASRKFLWLDTAYAKWTPVNNADWMAGVTFGKMDSTLALSPMVIDADYQPEGAALQLGYNLNENHSLKFNGVFWVLDEFNQGAGASRDPYLLGAQLVYDAKWTPKLDTSLSAALLDIQNKNNLTTGTAPDINGGNTHSASTAPDFNFHTVVLGGSTTYKLDHFPLYEAAFPIKLGGEWMKNLSSPIENEAWNLGITLGKAGHKGLWEIGYKYELLRGNAWYEELVDDDFGAYYSAASAARNAGPGFKGGTNVKGHVLKTVYNFTDAFSGTMTLYFTEQVNNPFPGTGPTSVGHFLFDLMWKF